MLAGLSSAKTARLELNSKEWSFAVVSQLLQPARKQNTLPSHIPRPTQHRHHIRALLRTSTSAYRNIAHIAGCPLQLLFIFDHARTRDHSRRDIVERDSSLAHLVRQILGQTLHASLRGRIVAAVDTCASRRDGGDVDDASPGLGLHVRDCKFGNDEG